MDKHGVENAMLDFFNDYKWHSSLELGSNLMGKKIVRRLRASSQNTSRFIKVASDSNFCIHKATKELWKFSEDGKYIEPVFPDDVLTEDQL